MAMLLAHRVDLVLDVAANTGQFGKTLRALGFRGRIVSFEPLSVERKRLLKTSEHDPLWDVAPQAAIGSDGRLRLNPYSREFAKQFGTEHARDSRACSARIGICRERTGPMRRLDSLAPRYMQPESISFLKIDTQGYEDRVMIGASESLERIVGLQLELSLVPLYEGQLLFND